MKTLCLAAVSLTFALATAPAAQTGPDAGDYLVRSAGKVLAVEGDDISRLSDPLKLLDGTTVSPDGHVRRADGRRSELAEGQSIDFSGKLGPVPPGEVTQDGAPDDSATVKPQ